MKINPNWENYAQVMQAVIIKAHDTVLNPYPCLIRNCSKEKKVLVIWLSNKIDKGCSQKRYCSIVNKSYRPRNYFETHYIRVVKGIYEM